MLDFESGMVEALEDGKIVKVSEEYAKAERLLILRRIEKQGKVDAPVSKERKFFGEEKKVGFDELRKPLHYQKNKVIEDLVPNFQWEIMKARRTKNITRKKLAEAIGVNENSLKLIENGSLPADDFVLINKLQNYLGINLRKNKMDYNQSVRKILDSAAKEKKDSIEILDE